MLRFGLERAQHQRLGVAAHLAGLRGDDVGPVGQHVGVVGDQLVEARVGGRGLGEILQHHVGACQHRPALGVVGVVDEVLLEAAHHLGDLLLGEALLALDVLGVERGGLADHQVGADGERGDGEAGGERPGLARPAVGAVGRLGGHLGLVEGTALELLAAPGVGGGVDAALGEFAIELGELLAQHAEHHGALARLGLATAAVAEQRRQDQ